MPEKQLISLESTCRCSSAFGEALLFEAFVAITAAILGGMAQGAVSLIAVRNPSIREWANHKSPTYMIVISSVVTAFVFSLLFVVYL